MENKGRRIISNILNKMATKKEEKKDSAPKEAVKENFTVVKNGEPIRTYTLEIHGEDAEKLAGMFASKVGGEVI